MTGLMLLYRRHHALAGLDGFHNSGDREVAILIGTLQSLRPMPSRRIQNPLPNYLRLPQHLLQHNRITPRILLQGRNQPTRMGHHPHLALPGCLDNQARQRRQQVGMQTGLGLVQYHHRRRPGCEQCGDQQQVPQGTVRQLRRRQWPQQPFLVKLNCKASAL